jgi:hypothetical protein
MNDENQTQDTTEELKKNARNIFTKMIDAGNKKYHFSFEVYGWVMAIIGLILLLLVLK